MGCYVNSSIHKSINVPCRQYKSGSNSEIRTMRNKMGGKSGAAKKKKRNQTEAELKSRHKIKSRCQISKSADTNFSEIKEGPKCLSFAPDIDFFPSRLHLILL